MCVERSLRFQKSNWDIIFYLKIYIYIQSCIYSFYIYLINKVFKKYINKNFSILPSYFHEDSMSGEQINEAIKKETLIIVGELRFK